MKIKNTSKLPSAEKTGMFSPFLNVINWFMEFSNKYSFGKIIRGIAIMWFTFISIIPAAFLINPDGMIIYINDIKEKTHADDVIDRIHANELIQAQLKAMVYEINSDRAWVAEFGNGTANTAGVPFLHYDIRHFYSRDFEKTSIAEQYEKQQVSLSPIVGFLYHQSVYTGSIDELATIDPMLASKLKLNGSVYIAMALMYTDSHIPLGVVGVSFKEVPKLDNYELLKRLDHDRSMIRQWLVKSRR